MGRNRPARLLSREPGGLLGVSGANGAKSCKSEVRARTLERKEMAAGDVVVWAGGALEAAGTRERGSTVPERLIHSKKSVEREHGSAPGLETPVLMGHGLEDPACPRLGDCQPAQQTGAQREPPAALVQLSPPAAGVAQGASSQSAGGRQHHGEGGDKAAKPSSALNNLPPSGLPQAPRQPQGFCCTHSPKNPNCQPPLWSHSPTPKRGAQPDYLCSIPGAAPRPADSTLLPPAAAGPQPPAPCN